jgi:hypothetical protein
VHALLLKRLQENVGATDPVVVEYTPKIRSGLAVWKLGEDDVTAARTVLDTRKAAEDAAIMAWEVALTEVYGTLVARHGKAGAERFFPKSTKRRKAAKPLALAG